MRTPTLAVIVAIVAIALLWLLRQNDTPTALPPATTAPASPMPAAATPAEAAPARHTVADPGSFTTANQPSATPVPPTAAGDLLLAGRVVSASGPGIEGARIAVFEVEVEDTSSIGARMVRLHERDDLATTTVADGRFAVHGRSDRALLVRAKIDGWVLRAEIECKPPAFDLVLVFDRAGALVATLAAESAPLAALVRAEVRNPGEGIDVDGSSSRFDDGTLRRDGLRPGRCDFVLLAQQDPTPLWTVPGVAILAAADTRDPRLQNIDLRPLVRQLTVRVQDAEGKPVANAIVWAYDKLSGRGQATDAEGRVRLVTGAAGADIEVRETGFRRVRHASVVADLVITLRPPIWVELVCVGADPALAAPGTLHVFVQPTAAAANDPRGQAEHSATFAADARSTHLELDGPGTHLVRWCVAFAGESKRFAYPTDVLPALIEVAESADPQRFEFYVDDALLRATAAR